MGTRIIPRSEGLDKFNGSSDKYLKDRVKEIDQEVEELMQIRREIKHELYRRNPVCYTRVINL